MAVQALKRRNISSLSNFSMAIPQIWRTNEILVHIVWYTLDLNCWKQASDCVSFTLQLYEEIQEHVSSEEPSYEEAMKLEYLDWVIDETLRLYPPAPR